MRSENQIVARIESRLRRHIIEPAQSRYRRIIHAKCDFTPIFVSGAMGSGTTLLAFELAKCFDVAGIVEESALEVSSRSFLRMPTVSSFQSVNAYERSLWPTANWCRRAAVDALQDLYRSRASCKRKFMIDKGPNTNLVRASFLASCFPDARFILLFRDPVANIEGFRRKWPIFGQSLLETSIQFYRRIHESFLEQAEEFRSRVVVVSYEQLIDQHQEILEVLRKSLCLDFASGKRALPERPNHPGQGIRNVSDNQIQLIHDANAAAYLGMSEAEIEQIRSELNPLYRRMVDAASTN